MKRILKVMMTAAVSTMAVASAVLPAAADDSGTSGAPIAVAEPDSSDTAVASEEPEEPEETGDADFVYTADNTADVYRMYNPNSGEHFYTEDYTERDHLLSVGWRYEGIGWTAPLEDVNASKPVYRVYNPNQGLHHYTMNLDEKNGLVALGWRDEGIGWYSDSIETVPLYREYNPNNGNHNYTTNADEDKHLVSVGWRQEQIGWYGVNDPDTTITHPVTIYNKVDLSPIYDFNYYVTTYPNIAKYAADDATALKNFATVDIKNNGKAKESYDQNTYDALKEKLYPTKKAEQPQTVAYPEAEWVFNVGLCARDLRAAYNFAKMPYVSGATDPSKGTHYYAHIGYSVHRGNCYVMAATFCELAKALGYNAVEVYGWDPAANGAQLPHSWVEIDGRIYDPEAEYELGYYNGWNRAYGERGTLRYHKLGYMGA